MVIHDVPIKDLKPYEHNAKVHTDEQIEYLANSLDVFGWQQPLVIDRDNIIIAGHGRYEAAKMLGLETAPCKYADELTDDQIKAYRLADNKTASTEYDFEAEFAELESIELDMTDFGFADFELSESEFSMDDIEEVNGFDANNNDKEYFTAAFTFPTAQKEQILKYLRKHKQEITEEIIQKASE